MHETPDVVPDGVKMTPGLESQPEVQQARRSSWLLYSIVIKKKKTYLTSLLIPGSKEHEKVRMFMKKVKHDPRFHMNPCQLLQVQIDRFH